MLINERAVLSYVSNHPGCGRSQLRRHLAPDASKSTVWRALRRLVDAGQLQVVGEGRATTYRVAGSEAVLTHLRTPMHLRPPTRYRKEFAGRYRPNETRYLTDADRAALKKAGTPVVAPLPASEGATYARRILEELEVDMSWASSRLEGNSYDILETDRLVRSGKAASGKSRRDGVMILNHKAAIRYVVENLAEIEIGAPDIRNIHALLAYQLISDRTLRGSLRRMPVEIGKSTYVPVDDRFTLREEFDALLSKAAQIEDPFEQSFFLLVHLPYLQPFADVNKRTSRIASLIPLLKADLIPMSFLAIDDRSYVRGVLGVYELNDVSLLREAYVNGYIASARRYRYVQPLTIYPERSGVAYRPFIKSAIQHCVLEWRTFAPNRVRRLMDDADIPLQDQDELLDYIRREFEGLTKWNAVLFGLKPAQLAGLEQLAPSDPPQQQRRPDTPSQGPAVARQLQQSGEAAQPEIHESVTDPMPAMEQ